MNLSKIHLDSIKETVLQLKGEDSVSHGYNLNAFEAIFLKLLDMVKIKNCWMILDYFNYDTDLKLRLSDKETKL